MWHTPLEWFKGLGRPETSRRICIGARLPRSDDIVIEIALGDDVQVDGVDARLLTGSNPHHLREVVHFCAQRGLPIGRWLITGLWHMPARIEQVARWVCLVAQEAGEASIWIDTARRGTGESMPARFEHHLAGHLRRLGCQVC